MIQSQEPTVHSFFPGPDQIRRPGHPSSRSAPPTNSLEWEHLLTSPKLPPPPLGALPHRSIAPTAPSSRRPRPPPPAQLGRPRPLRLPQPGCHTPPPARPSAATTPVATSLGRFHFPRPWPAPLPPTPAPHSPPSCPDTPQLLSVSGEPHLCVTMLCVLCRSE